MLTVKEIASAKVGLHADGRGLYLQVSKTGGKAWIFRYQLDGRRRAMGLGATDLVGLAEARAKAAKCRELVKVQQLDPIEIRQREAAARATEKIEAAKKEVVDTANFETVARSYILKKKSEWKSRKHEDQWTNTLKTYAFAKIGHVPISEVSQEHVLEVLTPIWLTKTETASRLRARIEAVLDFAHVSKLRGPLNPAAWKKNLEHLLASPRKVQPVRHHPAVPYIEVASVVRELAGREGSSARCLEFLILTASRSGEALGARWDEINSDLRQWLVPKERMKGGREHRVPLSDAAIAVLASCGKREPQSFIFLARDGRKTLTDMALTMMLRRMRDGVTVHGFRSAFRDWAAESTNYPNEMAEMALAHRIASATEAAYRRGDMLDRRRAMMEDWATFCGRPRAVLSAVDEST